jgi:hypothetical protein
MPIWGASDGDALVVAREREDQAGALSIELGARASFLRLALVALTSVALLGGTLGLELWLNVHAAGIGLPLP